MSGSYYNYFNIPSTEPSTYVCILYLRRRRSLHILRRTIRCGWMKVFPFVRALLFGVYVLLFEKGWWLISLTYTFNVFAIFWYTNRFSVNIQVVLVRYFTKVASIMLRLCNFWNCQYHINTTWIVVSKYDALELKH